MIKFKKVIAFTLIELIIVIAIISILAAIVVIFINPSVLFSNGRNSTRVTDIGNIKTAISRYLADSPVNGVTRNVSDLAGYSQLLSLAQAGTAGNCPGGINGVNSTNTPSTTFSLSNTNGSIVASNLDISLLLNGGYLTKVPKDPLNQNNYQACFDTYAGNPLIVYSSSTEILTTLYSSVIGDIQAFKPTFLTNLQGWYDATQISGISSGQALCTWKDLSGNSIDAIQGSSNLCPKYQKNYYNTNKPAVVYNNSVYQTLESNSSIFAGLNSYSIVIVLQQTGGQGCMCALRTNDDAISLEGGALTWVLPNNPSGGTYLASGAYQSSPTLLTLTVNNLSNISSFRNGQSVASATATLRQTPSGYLAFGRDQSVHAFGGLISEIIIYKYALPTNDRVAVENYLNQKYGLY